MHVPPNILSAFVTLLVTTGLVETAIVFASLSASVHPEQRGSLARRSILLAGLVLLLFATGGALSNSSLPRSPGFAGAVAM